MTVAFSRKAALKYFAHEPMSPCGHARSHQFLNPPDEVALQFLLVLETLALDARLALFTVLPVVLGHFITANVNVFARK